MKTPKWAFLFLVFLCILSSAFAETEPNNTWETANVVAVGSSTSGSLGLTGDNEDWYKITLPNDGQLKVWGDMDPTLDLSIEIYDINGTSGIGDRYTNTDTGIPDSTRHTHLKAGTYYIKTWCAKGYGSYTLKNKFIPTGIPNGNDNEPNDKYEQAVTIVNNGQNTGHLGYFSNGSTDNDDWYKITLPNDGQLKVWGDMDPTLDLSIEIYDVNGTSYIGDRYCNTETGIPDSTRHTHLKAGTYFIKTWNAQGYGSYTLKNKFIPTGIPNGNDSEPNDKYEQAITIVNNGQNTGHLGYFSNGSTDNDDWYKITLLYDGGLKVWGNMDPTLDLSIEIYDVNGTSYIGDRYCNTETGIPDSTRHTHLKAGTYYIKTWCAKGYGSYTLKNKFTPTGIPNGNDSEPNDKYEQAVTIVNNGQNTGHLGYFSDGSTDNDDWYKITLPNDGQLKVWGDMDPALDLSIDIYDVNGTSYIGDRYCNTETGIPDSTRHTHLKAGTYYIKTWCAKGYGSYTLKNKFTPTGIPNGNDNEPNDEFSKAQTTLVNGQNTGHLGYFSNGSTDNDDWYKITLPNDGGLKVWGNMDPSLDLSIDIYDIDGTSSIGDRYTNTDIGIPDSTRHTNLKAGTYYIKTWNAQGYGSYTLFNKFTYEGMPTATIILTSPNGGENWQAGSTQTITWTSTNVSNVKIEYSTDNATWNIISSSYPASTGSYAWTIPNIPSTQCKVRISDLTNPNTVADQSDNGYTIAPGSSIAISEIEPNNSFGSANNTGIGYTVTGNIVTGTIGYSEDTEDWYKLILDVDGKLVLTETTGIDLWSGIYLYDADGTHRFALTQARKNGIDTLTYDNLAAGTYYIKILNWGNGQGAYTLKIDHYPAELTKDGEINDTYIQANTIAVNSTLSGHIGYYSNQYTDVNDWYKVIVPSDGKLEVIQDCRTDLWSGIYLYDADGSHQFAWKEARKNGIDTLTYSNLIAGIYYVRILNWGNGYGSYKITVNHYPFALSNDQENNDTYDKSVNIGVNTSTTGHIGNYSNQYSDVNDWYKVIVPSDGKLEVIQDCRINLWSGIYLYDADGNHQFALNQARKNGIDTLTYSNLMAGTFYIQIVNWSNGYGEYQLKVNHYPAEFTNDSEPNNSSSTALNLNLNNSATGHIGFYSNQTIDTEDWYKVTLSASGKLRIVESTTQNLWSGIVVYDSNMSNVAWAEALKGGFDILTTDVLLSGSYYIKVYNWNNGYGSYSLKVEPNEQSEMQAPIAYYPFNGNVNDESGNGWNGTFGSATSVTDRFGSTGKAYYLNGNGDYLKLPNIVSKSFTVNFWVKTTQQAISGSYWHNGNGLVDAEVCGYVNDWGTTLIDGGKVAFGIGPDDITIKSLSTINDNKWYMVSATRDFPSGEFKLYINGNLENSGITGLNELNSAEYIGVGNDPCGINANDRWFAGSLDDIKIYNRVLLESELQLLFKEGGYNGVNQSFIDQFVVFPNPSSGVINLRISNNEIPIKLEIFDINGRVCYISNYWATDRKIDLSGLQKGLYVINVTCKDKVIVAKFSLQ